MNKLVTDKIKELVGSTINILHREFKCVDDRELLYAYLNITKDMIENKIFEINSVKVEKAFTSAWVDDCKNKVWLKN